MRTLSAFLVLAAAASAGDPPRGAVRGKELEDDAAGRPSSVKRPKFQSNNWEQRAAVAEQQGKPVMYWVDAGPSETDDADEFFVMFPEAVHLLVNSHPAFPGKSHGVVFRGADGFDYWIADGRLNADTARKVRGKWEGEREPLTAGRVRDASNAITLTAEAKRRILARTVETDWKGATVEMTLDGYTARGGTIPASYCKAAGFTAEETAYALSLGGRSAAARPAAPSSYAAPARQEYNPPPAPRPAPPRAAPPPVRTYAAAGPGIPGRG